MVHSLIRDSDDRAASAFVHPSAIVEDGAVIGNGTRVWHRGHLRAGSHVGCDCTLGFAVYVDTMVTVGDRCKIQNHVSLFRGVVVEDDVFIGPSVAFTNDLYPRASSDEWDVSTTRVHRGASIGANATIVCGIEIGEWAMIAAGAVVTKDVRPQALIVGTPGRQRGWVCRCGLPLGERDGDGTRMCRRCGAVPDPGGSS
jgi:acetyltransferase-like isoleucine patch superfamily enzyme